MSEVTCSHRNSVVEAGLWFTKTSRTTSEHIESILWFKGFDPMVPLISFVKCSSTFVHSVSSCVSDSPN